MVCGRGGQRLPAVRLCPENWDGERVLLALSGRGKDCLDDPAVQLYLKDGYAVIGGDLFLTGEFAGAERVVAGTEGDNRFFTAFHYTDDAFRVQDAALLMAAAKSLGGNVTVWGEGVGAAAAACTLGLVEGVALARLQRSALEWDLDIPGIGILGGVRGCLELADCPVELF